MRKLTILLLILTMVLCACGDAPEKSGPTTTPTTRKLPESTASAEPDEPVVTANPAGVYRITGLRTGDSGAYDEREYGELCVYEDHTGDIYFDEHYHDFTWVMEGSSFIATTTDEPSITIHGTLSNGVMELVYEENLHLRFEIRTQQELEQEAMDYLREWMVDSVETMAVAYLGWYGGDEALSDWLKKMAPNMLELAVCLFCIKIGHYFQKERFYVNSWGRAKMK
jgi:hypothetical protein